MIPLFNLLTLDRIAVVVPSPSKGSQLAPEMQPKDESGSRALRWTASKRTPVQDTSPNIEDRSVDHSVYSSVGPIVDHGQNIASKSTPKPIGIVTFEDIIGAILQKPTLYESDFFNHGNVSPRTKCNNIADCVKFKCKYVQDCHAGPLSPRQSASFRPSIPSTMRRRNVSNKMLRISKTYAVDGIDELDIDRAAATVTRPLKVRNCDRESSHARSSRRSLGVCDAPGQIEKLTRSSSRARTESLPSRKVIAAVFPDGSTSFWRHVSAAPRLPQLSRVTPFSRQNYSSYERMNEDDTKKGDSVPPLASECSSPNLFSLSERRSNTTSSVTGANKDLKSTLVSENAIDRIQEGSQEAFSLVSWCPAGLIDVDEWNAGLHDSPTITTGPIEIRCISALSSEGHRTEDTNINTLQYQGFPLELLTTTRKENNFSNPPSSTLPRINSRIIDIKSFAERGDKSPRRRDESFHDDRALLPSQRRLINNSAAMSISGTRSSSF
jgi:metal transporter CNNM